MDEMELAMHVAENMDHSELLESAIAGIYDLYIADNEKFIEDLVLILDF